MTHCCSELIDALPRCRGPAKSRDELAFHAVESLPMGAMDWECLGIRCLEKAAQMRADNDIVGVVSRFRNVEGIPVGSVIVGGRE